MDYRTYCRTYADRIERVVWGLDGSVGVEEIDGPKWPSDEPIAGEWVPDLPPELEQIEQALVAAGWPPMSPWWRKTIGRAYLGRRRNVVIRGGRRGGKSTTLCRVAVYEALYGGHVIPPGDVGYFAIISAEKDQARERLVTCDKILDVIGVEHKFTTDRILIADRDVGIRVFTASLQGVVSFTAIGGICDEEARWRDKDTGANPAKQVLSSLRPTMATQPRAMLWHVSSPWSTLDTHHEQVERGTDDSQLVFCAPTWVMNPTLTEEDTHALEPDFPSWEREYAAIPMSADETKFFSAAHIAQASQLGTDTSTLAHERVTAGGDFAFRRDASASVVLAKYGRLLVLLNDEERKATSTKPLVPSVTIKELVQDAIDHGADALACDLHYIESVREVTDELELPLLEFPTDSDGIARAYVRARVLLSEGLLDLSRASPRLIEQLKETVSKPTANAGLTIEHKRKGGAHGDLVSSLVAAIWAIDQEPPLDNPFFGSRRFPRYEDLQSKLYDTVAQADAAMELEEMINRAEVDEGFA